MSVPLKPYRDFWARFFVSLFIALFLYGFGGDSFSDLFSGENFIPDVLAGFILTFIITSLINLVTAYLDIYYPWHQYMATRIVYQLIAGVLIMSMLVLAYMYTYLIVVMGYRKEDVTFFHAEFPISVIFIIFWNILYVGLFFYRVSKNQKKELTSLQEKLFTLQNVTTGNEMLPTTKDELSEENNEEEETDPNPAQSEKIKILIAVSGNKNIPLPVEKIAYFFKNGNYTTLKTFQSETYLLNHSLDELAKLLEEDVFFRANRQFIINLKACDFFTNEENGKLALHLIPGHSEEVIVSQKRAPAFKDWLNR